MDPLLDLETKRLLVSATLTAQVRRRLGDQVTAGSGKRELLDLARGLTGVAEQIGRAYLLDFDPAYPGVTAGPTSVGRTHRLVLACRVSDCGGSPIGVVFTALISGRSPHVSVAPPSASIPDGWRSSPDR